MRRDGGLRALFLSRLPNAFWQSIETGGTGLGVPDAHYCFPKGCNGWIEYKQTDANAVVIRPEQVAWIERYHRNGGRVFVAVRQQWKLSSRKFATDNLWLVDGSFVRTLLLHGLSGVAKSKRWSGGPANWRWDEIEKILTA